MEEEDDPDPGWLKDLWAALFSYVVSHGCLCRDMSHHPPEARKV